MSQLDKVMWYNNIVVTLLIFLWVFVMINEYFITGHYTKMRFLYFENVWKIFEGYWSLRNMEILKYLVLEKEFRIKRMLVRGNEYLNTSFLF